MAPLAEHIQENPGYICNTCNTSFKTAYALRLHNLYTHSNSIPCPMCKSRFFTCLGHLDDHITQLHPLHLYPCELCVKTFLTLSRLLEHANNHENYRCDLCDRSYESLSGLCNHKKKHIECKCELCEKIFANESELSIHVFNDHTTRYQCSICPDKYFPTPEAFGDHKKKNHRKEGTYIIRKRNGSTSSQQQIHEDSRPGPSSYTQCTDTYETLDIDTDDKFFDLPNVGNVPYLLEDIQCTIGDMSADVNAQLSANLPYFGTNYILYSHRRSFTCIECQKTLTVGDPIGHMNYMFTDEHFSIIEDCFICDDCQLRFHSFVELYHHTEEHCVYSFLRNN